MDTTHLRLEDQLGQEVDRIAADLQADTVTAFVYEATTATFPVRAAHGLRDPATFFDYRMAPRTGRVAGKIVRDCEPLVVGHVQGRSPMDGPFARREGILSAAGYPILDGNRAVGALFVSFRQNHYFDDAEKTRIAEEAELLANLIVTESPWEELRRQRHGEHPRSLENLLKAILTLACDSTNLPVAIWQLRSDGKLTLCAGTGLTSPCFDTYETQIDDGKWLSQIVESGEEVSVDDLQNQDWYPFGVEASKAGWMAATGVPIHVRGRVRGVVAGFSYDGTVLPTDRDVLHRLSELVSVTFEMQELNHDASVLADISERLSQVADFSSATRIIVDGAIKATGAANGGIYRVGKDGMPLVLHSNDCESCMSMDGGSPSCVSALTEVDAFGHQGNMHEHASYLHVPMNLEGDRTVLYVCDQSPRQFGPDHRKVLESLAHQASAVMRWPRLLLRASAEVERESARLFDQDRLFDEILSNAQCCAQRKFDFAALQLVGQSEPQVIETVCGLGRAAEWQGRAKHYLEKVNALRDIQADIALADPPRCEIISRRDDRFDPWIFEAFRHEKFARAWVPVLLARGPDGRGIEGQELDTIVESITVAERADQSTGQRTILDVNPNNAFGRWEIIGTLEAGYIDCDSCSITKEDALSLVKLAARFAPQIHRTYLEHVFQTIVDHAVRIVGATYASLHFNRRPDGRYAYEVVSGQVDKRFLERCPPRQEGIGSSAIREGRAQFVPDASQYHSDGQLLKDNPALSAEGITAMAAAPLRITAGFEERDATRPSDGSLEGVLYVGFRDQGSEVHRFTSEELGWLQVFANSAAHAIQRVMAFKQMRDQARLVATLHSVAQSLASIPEDPELLRHISWNILNVLGADVVTIYQYHQHEGVFETPPTIAGRLIDEKAMRTNVRPCDTPALLLDRESCEPLWVHESVGHQILDPPHRNKAKRSFVKRERIASSAAIPLTIHSEMGQEQEVVGIMFVNYRRPHDFTESRKKVIEALASTAAVAIKNRRLVNIFRQTDHDIIGTASIDEVLGRIVGQAIEYTGAHGAGLRLFEATSPDLIVACRVLDSLWSPDEFELTEEARRSVDAWITKSRQSALINDYANDPICSQALIRSSGSELSAPLIKDGRFLGILSVYSPRVGAFQRRQLPILEGLAVCGVLALLNSKAQTQLKTNEKLSTIGAITGTLLHRLKNDLLAISHEATKPQKGEQAGESSKEQLLGNMIRQLTGSFLAQVARLRNFGDSGTSQPVKLADALQLALDLVRIPTRIEVRNNLSKQLPLVTGDESLLAEVFAILLKNGIEAMPDAGHLIIDGEAIGPDGSWAVVRVTDTGKGIDDLTKATLFQLKHTSKTGGLGVGLWLAHSYIELLGGQLRAESVEGSGSTFFISLPSSSNGSRLAGL